MTEHFRLIHKSTKNLPEKTNLLNLFPGTTLQIQCKGFDCWSKCSLIIVFLFHFFSLQVSGECSCGLENSAKPLFSSFQSNHVAHLPIRITTRLRKKLRAKQARPCKFPIHLSFSPVEVPPTACQLCASEGNHSLPASSCPRVRLTGLTGWSDAYWYNLIGSYAGEGGNVFPSRGWGGLAHLSPPPFSTALPGQTPKEKVVPQAH